MELFRELNKQGTTIVQVTHSDENARFGSRILELRDGWLVERHGRIRIWERRSAHDELDLMAISDCWLLHFACSLALAALPRARHRPQRLRRTRPHSQRANRLGCAGNASADRERRGNSATLAQTMQQAQQQTFAPQQKFTVPLPHSHNPFSPYRPSMPPPLNLANSARLQNLIRDGKLYIRYATRSLSLSKTISISPTSAITSPSGKWTCSAPRPAVTQTASTPPSSRAPRKAALGPPAAVLPAQPPEARRPDRAALLAPRLDRAQRFPPSIPSSTSRALSITQVSLKKIHSSTECQFLSRTRFRRTANFSQNFPLGTRCAGQLSGATAGQQYPL